MKQDEWESEGMIAFEMASKVINGKEEHALHVLLNPNDEPRPLSTKEALAYATGLFREGTRACYMASLWREVGEISGSDEAEKEVVFFALIRGLMENTPEEEQRVDLGDITFHAALTSSKEPAIGIVRNGKPIGGMPAEYIFEHAAEVMRGITVSQMSTVLAVVLKNAVEIDDYDVRHYFASLVGMGVAKMTGTVTDDGEYHGGRQGQEMMPEGIENAKWQVDGSPATKGGSIRP